MSVIFYLFIDCLLFSTLLWTLDFQLPHNKIETGLLNTMGLSANKTSNAVVYFFVLRRRWRVAAAGSRRRRHTKGRGCSARRHRGRSFAPAANTHLLTAVIGWAAGAAGDDAISRRAGGRITRSWAEQGALEIGKRDFWCHQSTSSSPQLDRDSIFSRRRSNTFSLRCWRAPQNS